MVRFLVMGMPGILIAIVLNHICISILEWPAAMSYAFVLIVQVVINFFMCRWFVFRNRKKMDAWIQFGQFLSGILFFRIADWALYTLLVSVFGFYYIGVQIMNVFAFSILKYNFSKKVMGA